MKKWTLEDRDILKNYNVLPDANLPVFWRIGKRSYKKGGYPIAGYTYVYNNYVHGHVLLNEMGKFLKKEKMEKWNRAMLLMEYIIQCYFHEFMHIFLWKKGNSEEYKWSYNEEFVNNMADSLLNYLLDNDNFPKFIEQSLKENL